MGVSDFVKIFKSMEIIIQRFYTTVLPFQHFWILQIFIYFVHKIKGKTLKNTYDLYISVPFF